jgi:hypothetical protein
VGTAARHLFFVLDLSVLDLVELFLDHQIERLRPQVGMHSGVKERQAGDGQDVAIFFVHRGIANPPQQSVQRQLGVFLCELRQQLGEDRALAAPASGPSRTWSFPPRGMALEYRKTFEFKSKPPHGTPWSRDKSAAPREEERPGRGNSAQPTIASGDVSDMSIAADLADIEYPVHLPQSSSP